MFQDLGSHIAIDGMLHLRIPTRAHAQLLRVFAFEALHDFKKIAAKPNIELIEPVNANVINSTRRLRHEILSIGRC